MVYFFLVETKLVDIVFSDFILLFLRKLNFFEFEVLLHSK